MLLVPLQVLVSWIYIFYSNIAAALVIRWTEIRKNHPNLMEREVVEVFMTGGMGNFNDAFFRCAVDQGET